MRKVRSVVAGVALLTASMAWAAPLQPNDLVAVCGDSITEQHQYSAFIEDYLLMCKPVPGVRTEQFGWGGETSWGFDEKMDQFTLPFKPTVATTCYGMNDGGYAPLTPDRAERYRKATMEIVAKLKKAGVHTIVLGSPGGGGLRHVQEARRDGRGVQQKRWPI